MSRFCVTLIACTFCCLGLLSNASAAEDPIREKLEKAEGDYVTELAKFTKAAEAWLDDEIKTARKARKDVVARVRQANQDREKFAADGTLPGNAPAKLKKLRMEMEGKYAKALTVAVEEYFRAGKDALGEKTQTELDKFRAAKKLVTLRGKGRKSEIENFFGLKLILVEPGQLKMGSPEGEPGRAPNEGPVREITITKPFYLAKYELTRAEWEAMMGPRAWRDGPPGPNYPAANLSWQEANEYCNALTERERLGKGIKKEEEYRLPTEAEWEFACRAGTNSAYSFGADHAELPQFAWYLENTRNESHAHPVGLRKPNAWGFHDMHGNVWEYCSDWMGASYDPAVLLTDPTGPKEGSERVQRGGCWRNAADLLRSATRTSVTPNAQYISYGFRIVRTIAE